MGDPRHISTPLDRYLGALYERCAHNGGYTYATLDQARAAEFFGGSAGPPEPPPYYGGTAL